MPDQQMIPVLFCQKDSIYKTLGCDVYDLARNAYNFKGTQPIIAHPPCRLWSRMRGLSTAPACEKITATWSVKLIQKQGGILEHPATSTLWKTMQLPAPGQKDKFGGFSICIDQHWFGHLCKKKTLLYICGITEHELPDLPLSFDAIEYHVSGTKAKHPVTKEIPKSQRSYTPVAFAKWLMQTQQLIAVKNA